MQTRQLIADSSVRVDLSRMLIDAVSPAVVSIPADGDTTAQLLLNQIYFAIADVVEPFTYGAEWILERSTGERLDKMESVWGRKIVSLATTCEC